MSKTTDIGAPLDPFADVQKFGMAKLEIGHPDHYHGEFIRLGDARAILEGAAPSPQSASVDAIGQDERALQEVIDEYARARWVNGGNWANAWQKVRAALAHPSISPAPVVVASDEVQAWKYRVLTDKHTTGSVRPDEIQMNGVWGRPSGWMVSLTKPAHDYLLNVIELRAAASQAAPATCQPSGAIGQASTAEAGLPRGYFMRHPNGGDIGFSWKKDNPLFSGQWERIPVGPLRAAQFVGIDCPDDIHVYVTESEINMCIFCGKKWCATPADPSRAAIDPEARDA